MNPITRWFRKRQVEPEISGEMAAHLAEMIDDLRDQGHSEEEARTIARRRFGNLSLQVEDSRAAWGWNTLEQLSQDLRYGCRVLAKTPAFTTTALIVLALGIGMNTAMFSAINAVLLSALPYPEPGRLVRLSQTAEDGHLMSVSHLDFLDWRAQSQTVERMSTFENIDVTLAGSFSARRARLAAVGAGFFDVLETQAIIGRTFDTREQKPGGTATIVLSYELAQSIFGMPASAIQKPIRLNGLVFTVIGIMPPKFDFPNKAQLWLPNDLFPDDSARSAHNYRVIGRLKSGATLRQAQSDMDVVGARLAAQYVDDRNEGIRVTSLLDSLTSDARPALWTLFAAVTVVLLIACVNISNLQLARVAVRRREMAMRSALGAARSRLIRQLLTENILLSGIGGFLGLTLAFAGIRLIRAIAPRNIPRLENLHIDAGILTFTAAVAIFAGLLSGLLPSLNSAGTDLNDALKQGGKASTGHPHRWAQTLIVGQIALAIMLLSGAALLLRSYWILAHEETGISSSGVYFTDVTWPASADGNSVDGNYVRQAGGQMLAQISRLPGVQTVAFIHGLPFTGAPDGYFEIEGRPLPGDIHKSPDADYRMCTPDYFKTFGIPILKGHAFTALDERSTQQVAIVNQAFVNQFFPSDEVLGKRIRFMGFSRKPQFMTIVGVVPDVRAARLKQKANADVYVDYLQQADTTLDASLVIRGPVSLQPRIAHIITSLNHDTAVNFESMDALISGSITRERFQTTLLATFAAVALLLALTGIYGLLSYTVSRRTSEIGVRMALGASASLILRLILSEAGRLVFLGLAIGLAASLVTARLIQAMLYQVRPNDPVVLFAVAGTFLIAAALASCLPALRAAHISPSEALRSE